jgi:predicted NACHT family NTPase
MQPTSFQWKGGTDGIRKIADIPNLWYSFWGKKRDPSDSFPVVPCVMADAVGIGLCIDKLYGGNRGMAKKKYRIAIMGASGAGKTVFLSSYFNSSQSRSQGKPYF